MIERASILRAEIADLGQLREVAGRAEQFRTRTESLEDPARQLAAFVALVALFRARGLAVPLAVDRLAELRHQAVELREAFDADRSSILRPDATLRYEFWNILRDLPNKVAQALLTGWASHVERQLPPRQDVLLEILGRVPTLAEQVVRMGQLYAEAARLAARLPQGDGDFARVDELAGELRASWRSLTGEGIPGEVVEFLRLATTECAPLSHLTPTVLDWLRQHGLESSVNVCLGSHR